MPNKPVIFRWTDRVKLWTLEYRIDFDLLHEILFAGSQPMPAWLISLDVYYPPELKKLYIARLNRLRKTEWIAVKDNRMWLTDAGIRAMPCWIDPILAHDAKRELKKAGITVLRHRIPWMQLVNNLLRNDPVRTPPAKWLSSDLAYLGSTEINTTSTAPGKT